MLDCTRKAAPILLVIGSLALAACGGATQPISEAQPPEAAEGQLAGEVQVSTADSPLGSILVDGEGFSLYMLTADSTDESVCTDACAQAWPPLTSSGPASAGAGADPALLGTLARPDGSTQISYDGHPLYYFQGDQAPGDVAGQGIDSFGGTWYLLSPAGAPITGEASSSPPGGGYDY